jgi:hypothetical protein
MTSRMPTPTLEVSISPLSPAAFPIRPQRLTRARSLPRAKEPAGGILFPFTAQGGTIHGHNAHLGPLPGGMWPEPATAALVIPLAAPRYGPLVGFLVAGVNPRQVLDAPYRTFFELVASRIATAIAHSRAYEAERELRVALREKEVLLQEIHHRVKNNLQVVVSLLDMQEEAVADPRVRAAFDDSQARLHAMALIHDQLYQSASLAQLNAADYLRWLSTHLFETYSPPMAGSPSNSGSKRSRWS